VSRLLRCGIIHRTCSDTNNAIIVRCQARLPRPRSRFWYSSVRSRQNSLHGGHGTEASAGRSTSWYGNPCRG
jgi:hypothetical protein